MLIGYARSSSADQDLTIQQERLAEAGCKPVFSEKRSGTKRAGRDQLELALEVATAAPGSVLVVQRLDRLARSLGDLLAIAERLKEHGASLRVLDQPIDTSSPTGELFFQMLGAFAQFETALRQERQREGIAKAKEAGVYRGRRPTIDPAEVRAALESGERPAAVARRLGISRDSVYRLRPLEAPG